MRNLSCVAAAFACGRWCFSSRCCWLCIMRGLAVRVPWSAPKGFAGALLLQKGMAAGYAPAPVVQLRGIEPQSCGVLVRTRNACKDGGMQCAASCKSSGQLARYHSNKTDVLFADGIPAAEM